MKIKSVLYPDRGYSLTDSCTDNWNRRGRHDLFDYLTQYDTYGDGNTQHSGEWCVQVSEFTDACLSLATAIIADPLNKDWYPVTCGFDRVSTELIAFAFSVVYKAPKEGTYATPRYFSLELRKITSSQQAQHDKRYVRIEPCHDGSILTVIHMLSESYWNFLQWTAMAVAVRDYAASIGLGYASYEDLHKTFGELKGDWNQAFMALKSAVQAVNALSHASNCLSSANHNSKPTGAMAVQPEVKALPEVVSA